MLLSVKRPTPFTSCRNNAVYGRRYRFLQKKERTSLVSHDPPTLCLTSCFYPLWIIADRTDRSGCGLFDRQSKKHQQWFVATGLQYCCNLSSCQALISDRCSISLAIIHIPQDQIVISNLIQYLFIPWLGMSNWNLQYVGWHLIEFPHLAAGEFVFGAY